MTSKHPAEIVEAVARGIFEDGGEPILGKPRKWDAEWLTEEIRSYWRRYAVAALDALGLTVTEEWAAESEYSIDIAADEFEARRWVHRHPDERLVRRAILNAETPWVEVES